MKKSLTIIALGILSTLGVAGLIRIADAQSQRPEATPSEAIAQSPEMDDDDDGEMDDDDDMEEIDEAQFQSLAKITPQQAQQIAEEAQGATARDVELEVEDGSLVYEVEFDTVEVLVDAGNGQILQTELEGEEEDDADEAPVQGSIQVPQ
ncbi:MAG: PepSY domain-containing protein [Elainellaceae cyanobacterium]